MKTTKDYYFDRKIILENLLIQDDQSRQQQQVVPKMLVVIDQKVGDYKILAAGVKSGAKVLILDSHRDGVEQITVALQEHIEISSIHIVSHGSPGCLYLGNSQLSLDTLNQYAPQLRSWFSPALLLYGCNVACKDAGVEFIERLNQLTGAKIAASATPTGNKALGGNWELEVTTDEMAVSLAFAIALQESYSGVLASGDLDSSFGNNGIVITEITDIANDSDSDGSADSIAIQPDGKIVVAGIVGSRFPFYRNNDFALVRYNSDGSLDNSFGSNGIVTIDTAPIDNSYYNIIINSINSVVLQPDGKIVLAGQAEVAGQIEAYQGDNFALLRYNSDGSLDSSFGSNGIVTTNIANDDDIDSNYYDNNYSVDEIDSAILQPDGKIIAVGSTSTSTYTYDTNQDFALARYNSDGTLDSSFGSNGIVTTDIANDSDFISSAILQSDGKIVVVGSTENNDNRYFALARYNNDGSLDTSFGSNGIIVTDIEGSDDYAASVALQLDGKILVAGGTISDSEIDPNFDLIGITGNEDSVLVRYNSDGSLDTSFGSNGIIVTDLSGGTDFVKSIVLQSDDRIVMAGLIITNENNDFDDNSVLVRYDGEGNLDSSFGSNGIVVTDLLFNFFNRGNGVAIHPDGRIIAGGSSRSNGNFSVAAYNSSEPKISINTTDSTAVEETPATDTGIYRISRNTIDGDLTIQLTIDSNSTIELSDYILSGGELSITDSSLTVTLLDEEEFLEITLTPIDDTLPENTETLQLNLAPAPAYEIDADNNSASITITANDEISYAVALNSTTPIVEGDTASQTVSFTVTRSGGIGIASSIDYAITSSDPLGNNDFNNVQIDSVASGVSGTISFAPGEEIKTITFEVLDDQIAEITENIIVTLSNPNLTEAPVNSSITAPTALVEITNDDNLGAGTITIGNVDNTAPINAGGNIVINSGDIRSSREIDGVEITPDDINTISNDSVFFLNKTPEDYFVLIGSPNQGSLQFTLTGRDTSFVNEVGVFIADDLQGRIDGIAPGDPSYLQATLERGQVIFSSLADNVFPELNSTRQLSFDTETRLGFYLVQDDTTDNVLADLAAGQTPANVFLNFSNANPDNFDYLEVSPLEENSFQLNWEDSFAEGEADFNDLVLTVEITDNSPPLGTQLQGGQQAELIDLRDQSTGIVEAEFVINSDAAFDNSFGFYVVDNPSGSIGSLNPGDSGYAQAAVSNRVDLVSGLPGKALLAPFLIADATPKEFLITNPNNQSGQGPLAYFAYMEANSDGFDHVRLLGDNLFGFEDLEGGGDADYNDLVVAVNFL
ncbi:MAG: DUF4347 domain-containing protein [Symploca sp. SIO1C4]|uniref:DUF4347 domain-containing protein n=1 Tax=Symploca sp. SIO1C4 TaxID=2607765 RepID=A0A6B3NCK4_9CYAN|nr:DUF4347 domain-containing protein [Symploca sp. SIO1C4]